MTFTRAPISPAPVKGCRAGLPLSRLEAEAGAKAGQTGTSNSNPKKKKKDHGIFRQG